MTLRPTIIGPTVQEFNGVRYYLCGRYFQKAGKRLHRVVWMYNHGRIPPGYDIHHRDGEPTNNDPDNLECLPQREHRGGRHGEAFGEHGRPSLAKAREAAAEWHGSPEGRAWHAEHYEQHIRPVMEARIPAACQECGRPYLVSIARLKQGKFCSGACKARALRKRRRVSRET